MLETKLSLVLATHNNEKTLGRVLDALPTSEEIQIVLLDDGSTDKTWEIALDWWKKHDLEDSGSIIHRWSEKKGYFAIAELGEELARGNDILFFYGDTSPHALRIRIRKEVNKLGIVV